MSNLNEAIQLIREGQKDQARQILEQLIKTDQHNVQAWFWYVETCATMEKRIQVLEVCLKMNPGNSQVIHALQVLHNQKPLSQNQTSSASQSRQPTQEYSTKLDDGSRIPIPPSNAPVGVEDKLAQGYGTINAAPQNTPVTQQSGRQTPAASSVEVPLNSRPKAVKKSIPFYEVWMTVLLMQDAKAFADLLDDPEAGTGRAFEWIAYSGIINGIILPISILYNPQFKELMNRPELSGVLGSISATTIVLIVAGSAVLGPLFSVIGLAIGAAIQNLLAGFFGGRGNFSRTVYALAAFIAPLTIASSILGLFPVVGRCLTSLLGIYNLILNVRALRAAHSLSTGSALGVILAPTVILLIFGCLLVLFVGFPNLSN